MQLDKVETNTEARYEEGVYHPAHLYSVEDGGEGNFGPMLRISFIMKEDDLLSDMITGIKMSGGTKLGKLVKALTGSVPESINTDELVGMPCNLVFETNSKDYDGETAFFSNVKSVHDWPKGKTRTNFPDKVFGPDEAPF